MEILNAYDLTGSYRAAADLCGCSHHTVKKAVEDRDAGLPPPVRRARMIDDWRDVLEGWVTDSKGKIRGDKAHDKLVALDSRGPTAPPGERWRKSNRNGDWAMRGCIGPGSPSPDCGCSTTSPTVPRRRAQGRAVGGVAGVEPIPGRDCVTGPDCTQCFRRLDRIFRIVGGARPTY